MIRTPKWDLTIDGKSIDEWGLRPLMNKITYDSEVGKFDSMSIEFLNGRELADAHELLKHGSVAELFIGYLKGIYTRVMLGFIKGVQIKGSSRSVTIKIAGYLAGLGKGEKNRTLGGQTVEQAVNTILLDYDNLVTGTIMNGDQLINDDNSQSQQTDLAFLEGIAESFGMFMKLEPDEEEGVWKLSMYEMGFEQEASLRPMVMAPRYDQQDPNAYAHLEEFDPESNILGMDVSIDVVSVNPIYRYSTTYVSNSVSESDESSPEADEDEGVGQADSATVDAYNELMMQNPYGAYTPSIPQVNPAEGWSGNVGAGVLATLPLGIDDVDPSAPNPYVTMDMPGYNYEAYSYGQQAGQIAGKATSYVPSAMGISDSVGGGLVTTRTVSGSYVVFECFGGFGRVEFQENVSSEEAQERIAQAIIDGEGFNFVSVKGAKLNEGDAELKIGQKRNIQLNDYPLFGDVFSGDYLVTRVSHTIDRGGSFETEFDGSRNCLTIPPRPVPITTGFGGGGEIWTTTPVQALGGFAILGTTAEVVTDANGNVVFDYTANYQSLQQHSIYDTPFGEADPYTLGNLAGGLVSPDPSNIVVATQPSEMELWQQGAYEF